MQKYTEGEEPSAINVNNVWQGLFFVGRIFEITTF